MNNKIFLFTKKIFSLSLILIFVLIFSFVIIGNINSLKAEDNLDSDFSYLKHKNVVVLLDNSGSMEQILKYIDIDKRKSVPLNRMDYALYSLGILASSLNTEDDLKIVPLNRDHGYANDTKHIVVDLKNNDRVQAVNNAYQDLIKITGSSGSYQYGSTPFEAPVKNALDLLDAPKNSDGSSLNDNLEEYWFVILSDGAFDGMSTTDPKDLSQKLGGVLEPYNSLHTIYIGFAAGLDLSQTNFVNTVSNSAYLASDGESLVQTMQKVSNQVSGKYDLNTTEDNWNSAISISENKLTIELDNIGFSVKDVSFLLQESSESLLKVELVEGKKTTELKNIVQSSYSQKPKSDVGIYKCLFGKLQYDGNKVFPTNNKQKIVFTFSGNIENASLSAFAEPALKIDTYYQYFDKKSNAWKECDELFISSNLVPNDKIRVGYHILDYTNSKKIPTNIFDYSKLTYCGKSYSLLPNEQNSEITLEKGSNEISIEVGIKSGNSTSYSLYKTLTLDIRENPKTFRVEGEMLEEKVNDNTYQIISFNIFDDDALVNKQSILDNYEYQLTIKNPNSLTSKKIDQKELEINEDGTIKYKLLCDSFGDYKAELKVLNKTTKALRGKTIINSYMPSSLKVEQSSDSLTISELVVSENTQPIEFKLSSDGKEFGFDNSLIKYQVTLEKENSTPIDITKYAITNGGYLTFVPSNSTLSEDYRVKGDYSVNVKIICDSYPQLSTFTSSKFTILEPVYKVEIITKGNKQVNLFNLRKVDSKVQAIFSVDGVVLTKDQIRKELRSNNIVIKEKTLGPTRLRQKIVDYEGNYVVELSVVKSALFIFRPLMASLARNIDAPLKISYHNANSEIKLDYKAVSLSQRIVTWVVYFIIIVFITYLTITILGILSKKTMLFRGAGRACIVFENKRVNIIPINTKKEHRAYIFRRFGWPFGIDRKYVKTCDDFSLKDIDGETYVDIDMSNAQGAFVNRYDEMADASDKFKMIIDCISELYYNEQVIGEEIDLNTLVNENYEFFKRSYSTNDKTAFYLTRQELNSIFKESECVLEKYEPEEEYYYQFDSNRFFVEYRRGEVVKVIKFI